MNDSYVRKAYRRARPRLRQAARELRQLRGQGRGQVLQQADHRAAQGRRGLGRRRRRSSRSAARPARSAPTPISRPRARRSTWPTSSTPRAASSCSPTRPSSRVGSGKSDDRAVPAQEGRRGVRRQDRRQGRRLRRRAQSRRSAEAERGARRPQDRRSGADRHRRRPPPGSRPRRRRPRCVGAESRREHRDLSRQACPALVRAAIAASCAPSLLGALSLAGCSCLAWHLLTKYRVNIYVRFLNVPSPEQVFESARRARSTIRNSSPTWHAELPAHSHSASCSPALVAVPLGLVMGRFRAHARDRLPGLRGVAADPRHRLGADVDHAVAVERGKHRLHHLPRLVLSDPAQHAARHGHGRSRAGARGAVPGRARGRRSSARSISRPRCRTSSPA